MEHVFIFASKVNTQHSTKARHPCHPCKHTNHANHVTHAGISSTQTCYPHHPWWYVTHVSTPPTLAPIARHSQTPLGITVAASTIDAGIQNKTHGSGTTTLTISNDEMNDIMKIVQAYEDYNILLKRTTKTIENEKKEQKGGFLRRLFGTL